MNTPDVTLLQAGRVARLKTPYILGYVGFRATEGLAAGVL